MRSNNRRPPDVFGLVILLGVTTASAAGCLPWPLSFDDKTPGTSCSYGGQTHRSGENFPSTDGCNTCACDGNGAVACTLRACVPTPGICRRSGCSSELCSDQNVSSDCIYRPEYACFKSATCERQADGACAFTRTPALDQCLAGAGRVDAGSDGGDGGGAACDFAAAYEFGYIGGLRASVDRSFLSPGNGYRHVRTPVRGGTGATLSCALALPSCGSQNVVTASDIESHDLVLADVRAALAETPPPLFGSDPRPVDGVVLEFQVVKGGSFLVGSDCNGASGCRAISSGIAKLRDHLLALDRQELATPTCQSAGFAP